MNPLIFVYGTLRRGGGADLEKMLPAARFFGEGFFKGKMALVADFPGVVDDPAAEVVGELYELAATQDFAQLDDYEDFRASDPRGGVYRREIRRIARKEGPPVEAWIYIYNRPMEKFPPIESGDFIRFLAKSKTGSME